MNFKVYVLAIATFTVGLVELIIGGILPMVATDLNVSISTAGQLITIFALTFAVAGPTLLTMTAKMERKRLYILSLLVFTIGCLVAFWGPNYVIVFISRIITASSGALITVLSLNIGVKIVSEEYRARVVGTILVGLSSAIVLGVPLGVLVGAAFGWRILFLIIAILTILSIVLIYFTIDEIEPDTIVPLRKQLGSLMNKKVITAHVVTCLTFTGHYTLYAYFAPFLETTLHLNATWISIAYFAFGLGAIFGGPFGGITADKFGVNKSILLVIGLFFINMILLPLATNYIVLFAFLVVSWGTLSWALSPPKQSYLIQISPESADFQQSINYSALQLGISLGSAFGGIVISKSSSVIMNVWASGGLLLLAFFLAIYSLSIPIKTAVSSPSSQP